MLNHDNLSIVDWVDKKLNKAPNSLHPLFSTQGGEGSDSSLSMKRAGILVSSLGKNDFIFSREGLV